jgi:carboxyl-terminal processing protease
MQRVSKFRILILSSLLIFSLHYCSAQNFHNLDFRNDCPESTTGLCNWDLSWGTKKNIVRDPLGLIMIKGSTPQEVNFIEQSASISPLTEIMILTLSGNIETVNVEGKGAGLNLNLYDKDDHLLAFKDMGGMYSLDWVSGTRAGQRYSISIVCPVGTAKIRIGAILYGKGHAIFGNYSTTLQRPGNEKASKLAVKYIGKACTIIKKNSLIRDSLNIDAMKATALKIAGNAKTYSDCFLAVSYLLESLREYGDYHSFLMKKTELDNWSDAGSAVSKITYPSGKLVEGYGYIYVPPFHGGNPAIMLAYADTLQQLIYRLDSMGVDGWIVDLRDNTGGNMAPMIAGLGPLFSSEKLGSLIDVNEKSDGWYYKNGRCYGDDNDGWSVSKPVTLTTAKYIAVLTSNRVGSSGEIVVISFIGNANTLSFGQATMGLTTGNGSFDLPDGSQLFIASTVMADRNGTRYTSSIKPDVEIDPVWVDKKDMVLAAALNWLRTHPFKPVKM